MNILRRGRLAAAAGAVALIAATQVSAHMVTWVADVNNWTFAAAGQVVIPAMTTPLFPNAAGQPFSVTFSSECAVNAPAGNTAAWTDVDIVVLNVAGVVVQTLPTTVGAADAFCGSNGTAAFDGWSTHSVTAVSGGGLAAGNYRVQVRARLNGGATAGWFGERTLLVSR